MDRRVETALHLCIATGVLGSLALAAAPVTWHLRGQTVFMPASGPTAPLARNVPQDLPDVGPVLALAPFGRADAPAPRAATAAAPLDMTLLGIIARSDPAESTALILTGGEPSNFKVGNKIGETVILDQVNADHVVLLVDGARQILGFPNADPPVANPEAATDASPTGMEALLAAALAPPATEDYREPAAPAPPVTTQDYINLWRARITANPNQVLDEIGLVPSAEGYTISENHDSGVARAGLQAGDLVKTVNGTSVGNVDRDRVLYDEVANSGMARVEIERDGRIITLSFPLQ